ncbi:MAG: glucose-6-phosphate dehydrogenase [Acidimicrobiales bacterium]
MSPATTAAGDAASFGDHHDPRSDALVIFGLTGDLGEKRLFPALIELQAEGRLPSTVISVDRVERSDDDIRALLLDAAETDEQRTTARQVPLRHLRGDAAEDATYDRLAGMLDADAPLIYAALPPSLFGDVAAGAGRLGDSVRLVMEKPFGSDAAGARELYDRITRHVAPERLFLVDHFLAKSSVENLMAVRRTNPWIDAALHGASVERVEVTLTETFGVDGRGSFYDGVGALRDVVQNHMLALASVMAMEPTPIEDPEVFAAARTELLRAIRPLRGDDVVLGQYDGYLDEDGVEEGSSTETYVSAQLSIDNERWDGVPFVLETGKSLDTSRTEAVAVFSGPTDVATGGRLRFSVMPDSAIALELNVLDARSHGITSTTLTACRPHGHGRLSDYAVMFDSALDGDPSHFATIDEIVAAWKVVEPVLDLDRAPVVYQRGSGGPMS